MVPIGMGDEMYEGLEPSQYLDLSRREMGTEGVLSLLSEMAGDGVVRQLRLSYNILAEELDPLPAEYFIRTLKKKLIKHRTLTALDLAGNHLFRNHPHPSNEHTRNYQVELTKALTSSAISHLDLSDNNMTGNTGRELMGLTYMMKNYMVKQKAFKCRLNLLYSQGFCAVSCCLGAFSSMTYLDLSCNQGGLDPSGQPNCEGTAALALQLKLSLHMRVLRVAENGLGDADMLHIAYALHDMPQFQDLDVASNKIRTNGARALALAIISHSLFGDANYGLRHIDISNNPLGLAGLREIASALPKTHTLRSLRMRSCLLDDYAGQELHTALSLNCSLVFLDVAGNDISPVGVFTVLAEVQATCNVEALRLDGMAVDCASLSTYDYSALARKLRYLSTPQLIRLHANPSFNVPESEMIECLHLLQAPPRTEIVGQIKKTDEKLQARLQASRAAETKLQAARLIYEYAIEWFEPYRQRFAVKRAMERAKERRALVNAHNAEDDVKY